MKREFIEEVIESINGGGGWDLVTDGEDCWFDLHSDYDTANRINLGYNGGFWDMFVDSYYVLDVYGDVIDDDIDAIYKRSDEAKKRDIRDAVEYAINAGFGMDY